jgi:hypothetical protein
MSELPLYGAKKGEHRPLDRMCKSRREHEHAWLDERGPGCEYCLLDPPGISVRVSDTGRRELDNARERYRTRATSLEQYDAERAEIIAAHPAAV